METQEDCSIRVVQQSDARGRRGWLRSRRILVIAGAVVATLVLSALPSWANAVDQGSRYVVAGSWWGTSANISFLNPTVPTGSCVLFSALVASHSAAEQMEMGLVRCNATTIDGTCHSGHRFTELHFGTSYYCYEELIQLGARIPTRNQT